MKPLDVSLNEVSIRFGAVRAVDGVSATLRPGAITGLLGRNGAGKSSLLNAVAGFTRPSSGSVLVGGRVPFDDTAVTAGTCLIREAGDFPKDGSVREVLSLAALRPSWDAALAERLMQVFELPLRNSLTKLSRGQRSALGAVVGIASRAPLTIFDEVYLGMDAAARYTFYDELLADYTAHPRTIILSSHLIGEVEDLFEHVLILQEGKLLLDESADELRERGLRVIGPKVAVDDFVAPLTVLSRQSLGRTEAATIYGGLTEDARKRALGSGLELKRVSIQDLFIHLTGIPSAAAHGGPEVGTAAPGLAGPSASMGTAHDASRRTP